MATQTTSSWFSKMMGQSMTLDNLDDLLLHQLQDLYSAEEQIIAALPQMAEAASSSALKNAFRTHLNETQRQKQRLEQIFSLLGHEAQSESCEAMEGLISEGQEIMNLDGDPMVKDAALIAAAQRVEHYEIAGYGCARTFARQLGRNDVADLLQQTLDEEGQTDKILTQVAEGLVNPQAARR
jgi:ferritin-like metal-binding protein YciE